MYESHYGFSAKPFQLKPDPDFFYGSKGHKRAMAYLEYGLSQGEGFIVITGEVGAGKTTLVRNLVRKLPAEKIIAAQIVNTHVDADDILRMVAASFGLPFQGASKTALLTTLEQFLRQCDQQGKRALLIVDEAQNLSARAVEELRMLSNFQTSDRPLLQTFLIGQPEFRSVLLGSGMKQLLQRVIATYHLGPLDAAETTAYIHHRLQMVGWNRSPSFDAAAFAAIHEFTGGIPRRVNSLCDRLLLMGYLEETQAFGQEEVTRVVEDITAELTLPEQDAEQKARHLAMVVDEQSAATLENVTDRLGRMERAVASLLDAMKKMMTPPLARNTPGEGS